MSQYSNTGFGIAVGLLFLMIAFIAIYEFIKSSRKSKTPGKWFYKNESAFMPADPDKIVAIMHKPASITREDFLRMVIKQQEDAIGWNPGHPRAPLWLYQTELSDILKKKAEATPLSND